MPTNSVGGGADIHFMRFSSKCFYSMVDSHNRAHWEKLGVLVSTIHVNPSYPTVSLRENPAHCQFFSLAVLKWC